MTNPNPVTVTGASSTPPSSSSHNARVPQGLHPICKQMRDLRKAAGLSLTQAQHVVGVPDIVLGSYERGDRQPPLAKAVAILNGYGYTLAAIPKDFDAVRLPTDMATELRRIADQIETEKKSHDVSRLPLPTAHLS
jgi:transcriptional regulator with XRE-family HTH domain